MGERLQRVRHDLETEQDTPSYRGDRQDDAVGGSFTHNSDGNPKVCCAGNPIQSSRTCRGKALLHSRVDTCCFCLPAIISLLLLVHHAYFPLRNYTSSILRLCEIQVRSYDSHLAMMLAVLIGSGMCTYICLLQSWPWSCDAGDKKISDDIFLSAWVKPCMNFSKA